MHLTRMHLNPARRGTRHLLSSPQRMHAAVLSAFSPEAPLVEGDGRVLWRVDRSPDRLTLFISSPSAPDLTHVVEQAGWPTGSNPWQTASLDGLLARLDTGQEWVFRLTANPVRSVSQPGGARGRRTGHVTAAQQEEWLQARAASWGFDALKCAVSERRHVSFPRRSDGSSHTVSLSMATFDGVLRVTDANALRTSLVAGLGRAKGYGCGLLTLAPPR
jgi:CRISPR system Cascade subunit CasE